LKKKAFAKAIVENKKREFLDILFINQFFKKVIFKKKI